MNDLISRQAAIDALTDDLSYYGSGDERAFGMSRAIGIIEKLPPAQPKRIKSRWLRKESDLSWWYECSECGDSPLFDPYEHEVRTPFCPWCGAEMETEQQ